MVARWIQLAVLAAFIQVLNAGVSAQSPLGTAFTYQGQLKDGGNPANGPYDMHFRLYDAAAGGTQLGPIICYNNLNAADGLFTATLDFGDQFPGEERYLEIAIRVDTGLNCANTTGFTTLSPRQRLTAAPNATFALSADKLDGLDSTAFLQSVPNPLTLIGNSSAHIIRGENNSNNGQTTGVTGVSTSTGSGLGVLGQQRGGAGQFPAMGAGVFGTSNSGIGVAGFSSTGDGMYAISFAPTGDKRGLSAESRSSSGIGVSGHASAASGSTWGGYFQADANSGRAVEGKATAATGLSYGGYFTSASTSGYGIYAEATSTTGGTYALFARSSGTAGGAIFAEQTTLYGSLYGVYGRSYSTSGHGVIGNAAASTGDTYGGLFTAHSSSGTGVLGYATALSGSTSGVIGQCDSPSGRGVYGSSTASTGSTFGGYFESASTSGYGVYGRNSATSGTIYGVRGYASTAAGGYAVYAAGDMGASGVKPFRIDHPQDPENKYLLHYSTESPEVLNAYSGTVTLDDRGEAVVELPAYFAAINKVPRYTLTAIGAPMPMLHIADKINNEALLAGERTVPGQPVPVCSFRIAGGAPGQEVSWEVKAVRNDLRMRRQGAPVEREKTGPERGKYQHPEYYGQPPELGMDYDAERERSSPAVLDGTKQ